MLVPLGSIPAQLVFQVCGETCPDPFRDPGGAAMCQARISLCESKLTLYNTYMAQLGTGVATFQLPAKYRELLQPFYFGNLSEWRFAFADRQPPDNATTDCNVTYFNKAGFVTLLRQGELDGKWEWLFHELRHFSQCKVLGSRDAYSKMWFGHLELAFLRDNNIETIHDRMLMENDASLVSASVMEKTRTMRDIHNKLVRPIVVTLSGPSGSPLADKTTISTGSYQITGKVTGGSDPLERKWWVKRPGMTIFEQLAANVNNNGNGYLLTTTATGDYTIRLHVRQPDSNLPDAMRQVVLTVVPPRKTY